MACLRRTHRTHKRSQVPSINMPKISKRRQLTGCLRRGPKRDHNSHSRSMHLTSLGVDYRHRLHNTIAENSSTARSALQTIPLLALFNFLVRTQVINLPNPGAALVISVLLLLQQLRFQRHHSFFWRLMRLNTLYHDIPYEEKDANAPCRMPRQNIRLASWSTQECYDFTGFTHPQLIRLYRLFGLLQIAALWNDGFIRVPSRGGKYLRFHPEEMFLFMMTKMRTGYSNKNLCDLIFGGHYSVWTYGCPWMLHHLDDKYVHIVGHQGLSRFVGLFQRFFLAIQQYTRKTTTHHFNDGTAAEHSGLNYLPFSLFGFIDCSIFQINRPYAGPNGDFVGSPRRPEHHDAQRAVYTGYKKFHGIKIETVHLPNGISTVFVPVFSRPHDVNGVLQMSGLDRFLHVIQQGANHIYSLLGDGVYNQAGLLCKFKFFVMTLLSHL